MRSTPFFTLLALAVPAAAFAQDGSLPPAEPISSLMFFTLFAALAIGVGAMLWFLRRRSNRDAANRALNPRHADNR